MNRLALLLVGIFFTSLAFADDRTRNVQIELKNQGFYFGEIDGKSGTELSAAIRRYQIRNGLEVTGELGAQTLQSLGIGGGKTAGTPAAKAPPSASAPPPPPAVARATPKPPVNLRRGDNTIEESDRRALGEEEEEDAPLRRPSDPSILRPPAPLGDPTGPSRPSAGYSAIFEDTPYATAPRIVQEQTLARAQRLLANRGHYDGEVDGVAGPETEEAVLAYQRRNRLPMTGKLDLETLNALRLLPGRGSNPPLKPFTRSPGVTGRPQAPIRGIWVE